ncbi:MAG: TlpA family protein disulfide reductase [Candidatus Cloacimonetes bacterium]|nr:TlpA family protein disulfide reductase [Candidatus Cloacimonadota bacterium]
MKKITILFILLLGSMLFAEKMPDFTLENSAGEEVSLYSALNDSTIVIVDFWATWCGPCCLELPHLDSLNNKYKNLTVIAISTDGKKTMPKAKEYIAEKGYGFTVLHDPRREVQRLLKVSAIPVTFIVAPDGEIFYQHIGYKEGDEIELEAKLKELLISLKLIEG